MSTILLRDKDNLCTIFEMDGKRFINVVSGGVFVHTMTFLLKPDEARQLVGDAARRRQLVDDIIKSPGSFGSRRIRPPLDV